jgi:hypothetical protein
MTISGAAAIGFGLFFTASLVSAIPEHQMPARFPLPNIVVQGAGLIVAGTALGILAHIASCIEDRGKDKG